MSHCLPVAQPLDPARFLAALGAIVAYLKETTGQSLHLVGDTRVLVPLALLLRKQGLDQDEIISAVIRIRALQLLLDGGTLDEWVCPGDSPVQTARIDEALGIAAAMLPLAGPNDLFDPQPFLGQVRQIVAARRTEKVQATLEVPLP
jgi:hypothetical protein